MSTKSHLHLHYYSIIHILRHVLIHHQYKIRKIFLIYQKPFILPPKLVFTTMFKKWNITVIVTIVLSASFNLRHTILVFITKSIKTLIIFLRLSRLGISSLIVFAII